MIFVILGIILILCAVACATGWIGGSSSLRTACSIALFERDAACAERDRAQAMRDQALDTGAALMEITREQGAHNDLLHDYALEMDDQLQYAAARLADAEEAIASMREYQVKPRASRKASAKASNAAGSEATA